MSEDNKHLRVYKNWRFSYFRVYRERRFSIVYWAKAKKFVEVIKINYVIKHTFRFPSAVIRRRLHVEQKFLLIDVMKPT